VSTRSFVLAAVLLGLAPAFASSNLTASVTAGSLGIGPEIGWRGKRIGLRANATFLPIHHSVRSAGVHYQGRVKLDSAGAMLDFYPFDGGFRLSGGARHNANRARAMATPTKGASVGGQTFTPAEIGTLRGRADVRDFAPALSIGYGSGPGRGFAWGIDGGALSQGRPRLAPITSSTGLIPQARLDAERADLQGDVSSYTIHPIVQLSAGCRF